MLQHKKISGLPNTNGALVGGDDWDDNHVYPVGTIFPWAEGLVIINGTSGFISENTGKLSASCTYAVGEGSKYRLTLNINVATLPVRAGATWRPRVMFEYIVDAYPVRHFFLESYNMTTGNIVFVLDNMAGTGTGTMSAITQVKALINIEVLS